MPLLSAHIILYTLAFAFVCIGRVAGDGVAFTSFTKCSGTCTFAQHAAQYLGPDGSPWAWSIFTGYEYPLVWKGADTEYPLLISWRFATEDGGEGGSVDEVRWEYSE
jgi:hypothetical protein